jgi:hypothetical protein
MAANVRESLKRVSSRFIISSHFISFQMSLAIRNEMRCDWSRGGAENAEEGEKADRPEMTTVR